MLKKNVGWAVALLVFSLAAAAWAAGLTVTYDGDPADFKEMNETSMGDRNVYPGTEYNASRSGNTLTIDYVPAPDGANIPGHVFGGLNDMPEESEDEAVTNNVVILKRGVVAEDVGGSGQVYGGYDNGDGGFGAHGNTVTIDGPNAIMQKDVIGGFSFDGAVSGNRVTMNDGAVSVAMIGGVSDAADATGNLVELFSGTVDGAIYGGAGDNATDNTVTVTGGQVDGSIYGGQGSHATDNEVWISGGTVDGDVYGGDGEDSATGNHIHISGGTFAEDAGIQGGSSLTGDATGNSVTVSGNPDIAGAGLLGGGAMVDSITGNTLNIAGFTGDVGRISSFENLRFFVPAGVEADDTILTVAEAVDIDLDEMNIGILGLGAGSPLQVNDTITLISAINPLGGAQGKYVTGEDGSEWYISAAMEDGTLWAQLVDLPPAPFTSVTGITGVPATAGLSLTLAGTVEPSDATNQTIVWSLVNPGGTATLSGSTLTAAAAGDVQVRADIAGGLAPGVDYTAFFTVTMGDPNAPDPDPTNPSGSGGCGTGIGAAGLFPAFPAFLAAVALRRKK